MRSSLDHGKAEDGGHEAKAGAELHRRCGIVGLCLHRDRRRWVGHCAISSGSLDLTVADLRDWRARWRRGGSRRRLDLAIGDLADWCDRGRLDLTIGNLADWCGRCGWCGLNLPVRNLTDWRNGRCSLDLSVGDLGCRSDS